MKKHLLLSLIPSALLLGACTLDRYPLTGPSTGTFPASEEEALAGLLAAYKNLANNVQLYEPFPNRWMDQLSDIGCTRTVLSHWPDFTQSIVTSNSSQVKQSYARIYKTAGRVHMVLDNLDNLKGKLDEQTYNQFKIELLCLRSFVYDQAVQLYGDIPFIDHMLSLDDYAYARTPKDTVIARIIKDMDEDLMESLPVRWGKDEWGSARLGRAAAYALKAYAGMEYGKFRETHLREVPREVYDRYKDRLPVTWHRRAAHFYTELERVERGAEAWRSGDIEAYGRISTESGHSSIHNWETGSPELIALYEAIVHQDGVYGGRFSGAGFKGCCMALIDPAFEESIAAGVKREYLAVFPALADKYLYCGCHSADGVSL